MTELQKMSLRAFSRSLGVSDTAVRKAEKAGRFGDAVVRDASGAPWVVNPGLAAERWGQTTRTGTGTLRREPRPRGSARGSRGSQRSQAGSVVSLVDAQMQATTERARKLRLENDAREGRLVPLVSTAREAFESMRMVRESMLNIPARIAGELAAETDAAVVFRRLDAAIREALTSTADGLEAAAH